MLTHLHLQIKGRELPAGQITGTLNLFTRRLSPLETTLGMRLHAVMPNNNILKPVETAACLDNLLKWPGFVVACHNGS